MAPIGIRPYEAGDAAALHEAARESVDDVFPWLEWCHAGYSLAEARQWIGSRAKLAGAGLELAFAIVDGEGRYLGGCGINQWNRLHRFGNLGYWVRSSATGRGVAREAVRLAAEFAFRETDLARLEIVCAVGNLRSQRVAAGAGAVREGVLRRRLVLHGESVDAVMFSLVRSA